MAAFGEKSYGSPLGAVPPEAVTTPSGGFLYSYSGYSNRGGITEITGFPGRQFYCGPQPQYTKYVVLVLMDGARVVDTLGTPANIPNISLLADSGVKFVSFYTDAPATSTIPGHDAMMTGWYEAILNDGSQSPTYPSFLSEWLYANNIQTKTVVTKQVTSGVATITTTTAHGYNPGDPVTIMLAPVDADFDGTYTISTTPTTTSFTYVRAVGDTGPTTCGGVVSPNSNITNAQLIASKDKLYCLRKVRDAGSDWNNYIPYFNCGVSSYGSGGYRSDSDTHTLFKSILNGGSPPTLSVVSYAEPDTYAHGGTDTYAHGGIFGDIVTPASYIGAIYTTDTYIKEIWDLIQAHPKLANNTLLIVTNDHGRGEENPPCSGPGVCWEDHGGTTESEKHIMCVMIGPDIKTGVSNQRSGLKDIPVTALNMVGVKKTTGDGMLLDVVSAQGPRKLTWPEIKPSTPTLVFPLTSTILSGATNVTWTAPVPGDLCGDVVSYELQYTPSLSMGTGWRSLATNIPYGVTSFEVDFGQIPYTEDAGLRIRARDSKSLCSEWSSSPAAFRIANHIPNPVMVISPVGGETFDNKMDVIWKEPAISDIDGHQVTYKIEITPAATTGQGWTTVPGAEQLSQGTTMFTIKLDGMPEGQDYAIRITAVDELGADSVSTYARRLKIKHAGTFFVDTDAPVGTLTINDGNPFALSQTVKLTLFGSDLSTGIKDVRFKNDNEDWSEWDTYSKEKFWKLSSGDGVKRVFVQFRDFANNVSQACDCEVINRILTGNGSVSDIEVVGDKLYAGLDKDGELLEYRALVKLAATTPYPAITALAKFGAYVYVASYEASGNNSMIHQYINGTLVQKTQIAAKITAMTPLADNLFIGTGSGNIYSYDGTSTPALVQAGSDAIKKMRSDGIVIYASIENNTYYYRYNGTTWDKIEL